MDRNECIRILKDLLAQIENFSSAASDEEEHRKRLEAFAEEQARLTAEAAEQARLAAISASDAADSAEEALRRVDEAMRKAEEALPWLTEQRLDAWTHNKTIQKAVESYRITPEMKQQLRQLRAPLRNVFIGTMPD